MYARKIKNDGFTLVEIIVTMVIIGVVASFVIPSFGNAVERMKAKEGEQILFQAMKASQDYILDYGVCTENLSNLDIAGTAKNFKTVSVYCVQGGGISKKFARAEIVRMTEEYKLLIGSTGRVSCMAPDNIFCNNLQYYIIPAIPIGAPGN